MNKLGDEGISKAITAAMTKARIDEIERVIAVECDCSKCRASSIYKHRAELLAEVNRLRDEIERRVADEGITARGLLVEMMQ